MQIFNIYNEKVMMEKLKKDSITVIHLATEVYPIKKIVEIYDLIDINLQIEKQFKYYENDYPWNIPLLNS